MIAINKENKNNKKIGLLICLLLMLAGDKKPNNFYAYH